MITAQNSEIIQEFRKELKKTLEWIEKILGAYSCAVTDFSFYCGEEFMQSVQTYNDSKISLDSLKKRNDFQPWNCMIPEKVKKIIDDEKIWEDAYHRIYYYYELLKSTLESLKEGTATISMPSGIVALILEGIAQNIEQNYDGEPYRISVDFLEDLLIL